MNKIVKIIHECAKKWDGVPTNNNGDKYILSWRLPLVADITKKADLSQSGMELDNPDNIGSGDFKIPRPDAPWAKDEPDEFEDIQESDIAGIKEKLSDQALISAVKTVAELSRAQDLQAYSRHPKIMPKF